MIIACDTSTAVCSVAVSHKGQDIFNRKVVGGQIHIEKLAPFLHEALSFCNSTEHQLEALAVAIGPGSFNGLRIGLATMKALAVSLNLPLIPIPTTDAMALSMQQTLKGLCRAVIYSHRDFVHYADYRLNGEQPVSTPELHYKSWDQLYSEDIDHYFGTADRAFAEWLQEAQEGALAAKFHRLDADAAYTALLAEKRLTDATSDLDNLEPIYNAKFEAKKWIPPSF